MSAKWLTLAAVVAVAVSLVLISGCGGGTGSTNGVSITAAQTQKGPAATFKFKDDGTAPVLIGYRGNGRGKMMAAPCNKKTQTENPTGQHDYCLIQ